MPLIQVEPNVLLNTDTGLRVIHKPGISVEVWGPSGNLVTTFRAPDSDPAAVWEAIRGWAMVMPQVFGIDESGGRVVHETLPPGWKEVRSGVYRNDPSRVVQRYAGGWYALIEPPAHPGVGSSRFPLERSKWIFFPDRDSAIRAVEEHHERCREAEKGGGS